MNMMLVAAFLEMRAHSAGIIQPLVCYGRRRDGYALVAEGVGGDEGRFV